MFEYVGSIHIHSVFSDGSGNPKDIAEIAADVGLDYIILTDHNTLRARKEGYERWYKDTLMLVGVEINDREMKNHYLAFGIEEAPSTRMSAKEYVHLVKESGGIGFIAHPHEKRHSMKEHPPYPWTEWGTNEFTGIEIWNHMSEWMEGLTDENKFNRFVHPLSSIQSPPIETLKKWDELNLERRVVGIGGIDAHAHAVNLLGFFEVEVFPYKVLFKSIRTHILLDKPIKKDDSQHRLLKTKQKIYGALGKGRCFVSNYYRGDAKGFRFFAESDGNIYNMGDNIVGKRKVTLRAISPADDSLIRIIKNGEFFVEHFGSDFEIQVSQPGAYRIEVYRENSAWIFSNHIRIGL